MSSRSGTWVAAAEQLVQSATSHRWSTLGLAATRITLAFTILAQLAVGFRDRQYIWGVGQRFAESTHEQQAVLSWVPWLPAGPSWLSELVFVAAVVAAAALLVGWRTRASCMATFVLWMLMMDASPILRSGAEDVVRLVLFYLCFADSGAAASLDARRRRGRGLPGPAGGWFTILLNNAAVVLIAHQIVMIYVGSALWKVDSDVWRDGTAVYYPLNVHQYSPWLAELDWLYGWAPFVLGATWSATVIQLAFPLLLLDRRTRIVGFVLITATHLAIGVLMGLMYFSLAMIAADAVLISDSTWRRAADVVRRRGKRSERVEMPTSSENSAS